METSKFIGGLTRAIVDVAVFGAMSVQPSADQWRENFAEAQVPYAKIMGCALLYCAGSLALRKQLRRGAIKQLRRGAIKQLRRGAMVRHKTRPERNRSNRLEKSASNSSLIISYR